MCFDWTFTMNYFRRLCAAFLALIVGTSSYTQNIYTPSSETGTMAVPFELIAPDAISSGMGEAGVATYATPNSIHWNLSKLAFLSDSGAFNPLGGKVANGISLNYTPWIKALVPDVHYINVAGYKLIGNDQAVSAEVKYFQLNNVVFGPLSIIPQKPYSTEFSAHLGYTRKLSKVFSSGISVKYVQSNVASNLFTDHKSNSVVIGLSLLHKTHEFQLAGKTMQVTSGIQISNIGSKMLYYTDTNSRSVMPQNLRIGSAISMQISAKMVLVLAMDLNKLLIPSKPIYSVDTNGNHVIVHGMNPNVSALQAAKQSFYDAPGHYYNQDYELVETGVLKEEVREINWCFGSELRIAEMLFIRTGFFYEHYTKGNRQFLTTGLGYRYGMFEVNASYLFPTAQQHPLAKTLRIGLSMTL